MTLAANSLPCVQVEEFEGPLDLLLDEVRRQNVAIEKISIAPIAARFLEYMHASVARNRNLDIEWVHMAATLIYWKSRSLLPSEPAPEPDADPIRDEIVRQLLAHRKQAAEELARRRSLEDARFSRKTDGEFHEKEKIDKTEEDPSFVSVWDLMQRARELARWAVEYQATLSQWRQTLDVEPESVTVAEMSEVLREYVRQAESLPVDALPLLDRQPSIAHRSALFLGLLELVRDQKIIADQTEVFGRIWVATRGMSSD